MNRQNFLRTLCIICVGAIYIWIFACPAMAQSQYLPCPEQYVIDTDGNDTLDCVTSDLAMVEHAKQVHFKWAQPSKEGGWFIQHGDILELSFFDHDGLKYSISHGEVRVVTNVVISKKIEPYGGAIVIPRGQAHLN